MNGWALLAYRLLIAVKKADGVIECSFDRIPEPLEDLVDFFDFAVDDTT